MTKNATDLILRDRLQFTADVNGAQATVYGRFDLSDYTSALERKGLSIKEVQFQLRQPSAGNTGNFPLMGYNTANQSKSVSEISDLKLWATTRAYENAADVGIGSPDVLCIEQWQSVTGPSNGLDPGADATQQSFLHIEHNKYGTTDLHPDGFPVVTDLLIGIAADNWLEMADDLIELDVMIIASPITITQKQLTEMLVQGQDQ
tara:strand:- start:9 stop:620 length:612 start_codon:yes stop_codon:yes gene_type:complete